MDQQLQTLINDCYVRAVGYGLTQQQSILLEFGNDVGQSIYIYVGSDEPINHSLPLNVCWLVSDENDADYFKLLKRVSKNVSGNRQHTWTELFDYTTAIENQYYDDADRLRQADPTLVEKHERSVDAHPNLVRLAGGQTMTGPLYPRVLGGQGQQYGDAEVFPYRVFRNLLNTQSNTFYGIMVEFNQRITQNEEDIIELKRRLQNIETGTGGDVGGGVAGARFYVHVINEPSSEIIIHHELDSYNIIAQVWLMSSSEGEDPEFPDAPEVYAQIIPESIELPDKNFIIVRTQIPIVGRVVITTTPAVA
ncbi:MAG: hypothetical protein K2W88_02790 [Pararheinheimera sp.]|nr:hypothetical protein [Rheinheimera sp.]